MLFRLFWCSCYCVRIWSDFVMRAYIFYVSFGSFVCSTEWSYTLFAVYFSSILEFQSLCAFFLLLRHIHCSPKWYDYGNVFNEEQWNEKSYTVSVQSEGAGKTRSRSRYPPSDTIAAAATIQRWQQLPHSHVTKQKTNRPKRFDFEIEWNGIDWMLAIRATTTCTNIGKVINERKEVLEIYSLIYQRAVVGLLQPRCKSSTSLFSSLCAHTRTERERERAMENVLNSIFLKLFSIKHSYPIWVVVGRTIA